MAVSVVLALDLIGTLAFAISGATLGVRKQLDLFGVLVLSFAAATAGGIARDALIGATPPAALADWRYLAVSIFAGLVTFYGYRRVERLNHPVLVCMGAYSNIKINAPEDIDLALAVLRQRAAP